MIITMSRNKTKASRKPTMASLADKYDLYLKSVQSPETEIHFINRVYRHEYGRPARELHEDFCGTFAVCCAWVKGKSGRRAIAVDIDPEPLAWGRQHNLSQLSPAAQQRIQLLQQDACTVRGPKADAVAAQNFSFCIFKQRDQLRRYFLAAYQNLKNRGVLVLDMMGGPEAFEEGLEDVHRYKGFTYVWDQHRFDPITHHATCFIHYRFRDGSEMRRAFRYDWRVWTIPEIRELLIEAGFKRADVYWEGTDSETGEGNDVYRRCEHAASDPAWIAYLVAVK